MLGDERLEVRDGAFVVSEGELRGREALPHEQVQLREPALLGHTELPVGEVRERFATPQGHGVGEGP